VATTSSSSSQQGLFRFDPRSKGLSGSTLVPAGQPVRSLARDGRGRLWLVGHGIKLVMPGRPAAVTIPDLPVDDHPRMKVLGSYSSQPDTMVVGLQHRGVLFVEVTK
jgi:hypothetical protein